MRPPQCSAGPQELLLLLRRDLLRLEHLHFLSAAEFDRRFHAGFWGRRIRANVRPRPEASHGLRLGRKQVHPR